MQMFDQNEIMRRRKLAEAMGREAVKQRPIKSHIQGISQLANAMLAKKGMDKSDADMSSYNENKSENLAKAMESFQGRPESEYELSEDEQFGDEQIPGLKTAEIKPDRAQGMRELMGTGDPAYMNLALSDAMKQPEIGKGFTLGQGQQRFGPQGQRIAGVDPKTDVLSADRMAQNLQLKQAGKPETTISNIVGGNQLPDEDSKMLGTRARGKLSGMLDLSDTAAMSMGKIDEALRLLDTVQTGTFEDSKLAVKKVASALGMDVDVDSIADAEKLRVFLGDELMSRVGETKGAVSNKEMALFEKFSANFGNTPEGNRRILEFKRAKYERDKKLGQVISDMYQEGNDSVTINRFVTDWVNKPENDLSSFLTPGDKAPATGIDWAAALNDDTYSAADAILGD